jgi:hypothetical protein
VHRQNWRNNSDHWGLETGFHQQTTSLKENWTRQKVRGWGYER